MRHQSLIPFFSLVMIFSWGMFSVGSPAHASTSLELPTTLHFLTPGGEDVELRAGQYQVEVAEDWLKLVPGGQSRSAAVLIEAESGTHEEPIQDTVVRLEQDAENMDVFHLAMLLQDGTGLETVGTKSGIRPRGFKLSFLRKRVTTASARLRRGRFSSTQSRNRTKAPSSPKRPSVDCGPYIKLVENHKYARNPAMAVFQGKLHVLYAWKDGNLPNFMHKTFDGKKWKFIQSEQDNPHKITNKFARKGTHAALAVHENRLHLVYTGFEKNLLHSYFDGQKWSPSESIVGQKSKGTPSLVVFRKQLHMVHLGKTSNHVWHSVYTGKGWTVNTKTGIKSGGIPALAVFGGRLHMVTTAIPTSSPYAFTPKYLYHSQFDGKRWTSRKKISGHYSKGAPALVSRSARLHLIHPGNTSDQLRYSLYGWRNVKGSKRGYAWFGEKKLSNLKSDSLVSVVFHEGCLHMAFRVEGGSGGRQEIRHTSFPLRLK